MDSGAILTLKFSFLSFLPQSFFISLISLQPNVSQTIFLFQTMISVRFVSQIWFKALGCKDKKIRKNYGFMRVFNSFDHCIEQKSFKI